MATKPTIKVIDPTLPCNVGIDFTGITVAANAATVQGAGERKVWTTHASIAPATCPDGRIPTRIAIVTSTGAATPATVTAIVETLKNGNWLVLATRDAIPEATRAIRSAEGALASAEYKARKAAKAVKPAVAPKPAAVVPVLASAPVVLAPVVAAPVVAAPVVADDDDLADFMAWKAAKAARQAAIDAAAVVVASAPVVLAPAPVVPTLAPKAPRKAGK